MASAAAAAAASSSAEGSASSGSAASCCSSSSSSYYPRWPASNQEAEHWEIPPEHFLAVHNSSNSSNSNSNSNSMPVFLTANARSSSSSSASSSVSGRCGSVHHHHDLGFPPPLAELTSALPYIVGPNGRAIRSSATATASPTPATTVSGAATPTDQAAIAAAAASAASLFHGHPFLSSHRSSSSDDGKSAASHPATAVTPFAHTADPSLPDTSTLAAADFDIDVRSGFMPPEPPVERLASASAAGSGNAVERTWEHMLDRARILPLRCGGGGRAESVEARRAAWQWRRDIRTMPAEPLSHLLASDIRYARRGHLVLAFLAHFYIHSQPPPVTEHELAAELNPSVSASSSATTPSATAWLSRRLASWRDEQGEVAQQPSPSRSPSPLGLTDPAEIADYKAERLGAFASTIPAPLAVPWCALSAKLDLPPILTYATTVLWNWGLVDPRKPASAPGNLRILTTFTGTRSEEWFYATSALIELRGVEALTLMRRSLDEAFLADSLALRRLALFLQRLAIVIADLERVLAEVRRECDPAMFYFAIRPWFRAADDPAGWHYEGVDPPGVRRPLTGPSAGQSSLIHALDQFLAVEHSAADEPAPSPPAGSTAAAASKTKTAPPPPSNATFMQRMSLYMPGHHRRFLEHLRQMNVRHSMLESQLELERAKDEAQRKAEEELLLQKNEEGKEGEMKKEEEEEGAAVVAVAPPTAAKRGTETRPDRLAAESTLHPIRRLALTPSPTPSSGPVPSDSAEDPTPAFRPTPLSRAYDQALYALKSLRDEHMRIATLYIITQARRGAPPEGVRSWLPGSFTGVSHEVAPGAAVGGVQVPEVGVEHGTSAGAGAEVEKGEASASAAKGTGGTPLVSFLKACRANTVAAMLEEPAPAPAAVGGGGAPAARASLLGSPVGRRSAAAAASQ
ncbi:hypothetical protein OC834_001312 [Tilletia horrida]|nr:hypothetical protein OC834_001312 [Tilletia horrida]